MNYSEKIFEILGVKPYEEFKIDIYPKFEYRINSSLIVEIHEDTWHVSNYVTLRSILLGDYKIIKIPKPTKEEQLVIEYARLCGYNWIAKDKNGRCFTYKLKPLKIEREWQSDFSEDTPPLELGYNLSFLSWEDKEPYYIGDDTNVDK